MHLTRKGWVMSSIFFFPTVSSNLDIVAWIMQMEITLRGIKTVRWKAPGFVVTEATKLALDLYPGR